MSEQVTSLLRQAVQFHKAGKLGKAEELYQSILKETPQNPDALRFLGRIRHAQGRNAEGVKLLDQALANNDHNPEIHYNKGMMLEALNRLDEAQASYEKAAALSAIEQQKILNLVRMFEPKKVLGFDKVRVGRNADGGYVQVNDFSAVAAAFSFGISNEASWDLQIAQRNIPVQQFDHTVKRSPNDHPLIKFHKMRVAASDGDGTICLDTVIERFLPTSQRTILKIDVEGDEWPIFAAASPAALARFSQIACEFHGFKDLKKSEVYVQFLQTITKLKALFEVVHVHGNNFRDFLSFQNVVFPSVLEITFANRNDYRFTESHEIFPTALDRPNRPDRPDLHLGCFKF